MHSQHTDPDFEQAIRAALLRLFKVEKSKIKNMNNKDTKDLVTTASKFGISDKKFVFDVLGTIEGRLKFLKPNFLIQLLHLLNKQTWAADYLIQTPSLPLASDKIQQRQAIKAVLIMIFKKMLEKPLHAQNLVMSDLANLVEVIEMFDEISFFQKSQILKSQMMSEIGVAIEALRNDTALIRSPLKKSSLAKLSVKYLEALIKMNLQLPDSSFESLVMVASSQSSPSPSDIELTLKKLDYILTLEKSLSSKLATLAQSGSTTDVSGQSSKLSFQLKTLKSSVLSIHNVLTRPGTLKNPRLPVSLLLAVLEKLMGLQDSHSLPCPTLPKRLCVLRVVSHSHELSLSQLEQAVTYLLACVRSGDDLFVRSLQRFAFDEYSVLTQVEFHAVGQGGEFLEKPGEAPGRLAVKSFRQISEDKGLKTKQKMHLRIQTSLVNSLLILCLIGKKNAAVFRSMSFGQALESVRLAADSAYLTQESWDAIQKISSLVETHLLPNHKPVFEEITKIYSGELTPAYMREEKVPKTEGIEEEEEEEGQAWTDPNAVVQPEIDPESTMEQLMKTSEKSIRSTRTTRTKTKPKLDKIISALSSKKS